MSKARSPAYPAIGLKEAVEAVDKIYREDYQNPLPREVAAKHMGYSGLNGKSLSALSALLKYGLLEGRGNDTRVSDRAVAVLAHEPGHVTRTDALVEAAASPELFVDIDMRFQGGRASDQAIRSYLIMQKFIPAAADNALRSYRETKTLLSAESTAYNARGPEERLQDDMNQREQEAMESGQPHPAARAKGPPSPHQPMPPFPHGVELPEGKNVYTMAMYDDVQGSRIRIAADLDLEGAKNLAKKLAARIAMMEEEASEKNE